MSYFPPIRKDGQENPLSPDWLGVFSDGYLGPESESTAEFNRRMAADEPVWTPPVWTPTCAKDGGPMTRDKGCLTCACYERR